MQAESEPAVALKLTYLLGPAIRGRIEVEADQVREAVADVHGCRAQLHEVLPVGEQTVWHGHPTATRAYAWSSPVEWSDKRRFYAVLHQPPMTSPADAVRGAIVRTIERASFDKGGAQE